MNRRRILKGLPAAIAVGASPAAALGIGVPAETPVAKLFREWQVVTKQSAEASERLAPEAEVDAIVNLQTKIEDKIAATPAQTVLDFAMKVYARSTGGVVPLPTLDEMPEFWAEARAFVA